jgi:hypothetical protein
VRTAHFSPINKAVESDLSQYLLEFEAIVSLTCVAANIIGADRKICDLQILDAMDVKALIKNTMLDNAVSFSWSH